MPLIGRRMARRVNHFMQPSLLESRFDALEEPGPNEWPIIVPIDTSPRRIVEYILACMASSGRRRN